MTSETLPNRPRRRNVATDPWLFLDYCDRHNQINVPALRDRFLELVAAHATTPQERDYLLAAGLGVFGYAMADAVRTVEIAMLDRALTA